MEGRAPPVRYEVNGNSYDMGYYLTDGIYPKWAAFMQSIILPQTPKDKLFAQFQEAARKDVERAFGVLQARFAIVKKPSLAWSPEILGKIMTACIILHNMIVEDERDSYEQLVDVNEFLNDRPQNTVGSSNESGLPYSTDSIVDINKYLRNRDRVRDARKHIALRADLIENIWQRFGGNAS